MLILRCWRLPRRSDAPPRNDKSDRLAKSRRARLPRRTANAPNLCHSEERSDVGISCRHVANYLHPINMEDLEFTMSIGWVVAYTAMLEIATGLAALAMTSLMDLQKSRRARLPRRAAHKTGWYTGRDSLF